MNSPVGGTTAPPTPPPTRRPDDAAGRHAGSVGSRWPLGQRPDRRSALTLSWNASTDNVGVTGYNLYRSGTAVGSNNASTRTYTFSGLSCGTTYQLWPSTQWTRPATARPSRPRTARPRPAPHRLSRGGLVAAYSFNGGSGSTLADSSGRGNAGTISGPSWTTAGKNGGALTFDGVNDLVTVADTASLDLTTGMTLEAWVRPTASTSWRTVVTKEQSNNLVYGLFSNSDAAQPSGIVSIGSSPIQDIVRGSARAAGLDVDAPRDDLRRQPAPALRQRIAGRQPVR